MRKSNQTGFSLVESLLLVIAVTLIAFVGYYTWRTQKNANDTLSSANSVAQSSPAKGSVKAKTAPASSATSATANNDLVIKEWGIKLEFADASKVAYTLSKSDDGSQSFADLELKSSVASVCQSLGLSVVQVSSPGELGASDKIGNYYYGIYGGPGACSDDPGGTHGSINQLRSKIDSTELSTVRIEAL